MNRRLKQALERLRAAAQKKPPRPPSPGDVMPDGTLYVGMLGDQKMFTMPHDAEGGDAINFGAACAWVKLASDAAWYGHADWKIPSEEALNLLYDNKDAGGLSGTFNLAGGWYWSGTHYRSGRVYHQRFSDGYRDYTFEGAQSVLRCVRMEKP